MNTAGPTRPISPDESGRWAVFFAGEITKCPGIKPRGNNDPRGPGRRVCNKPIAGEVSHGFIAMLRAERRVLPREEHQLRRLCPDCKTYILIKVMPEAGAGVTA